MNLAWADDEARGGGSDGGRCARSVGELCRPKKELILADTSGMAILAQDTGLLLLTWSLVISYEQCVLYKSNGFDFLWLSLNNCLYCRTEDPPNLWRKASFFDPHRLFLRLGCKKVAGSTPSEIGKGLRSSAKGVSTVPQDHFYSDTSAYTHVSHFDTVTSDSSAFLRYFCVARKQTEAQISIVI